MFTRKIERFLSASKSQQVVGYFSRMRCTPLIIRLLLIMYHICRIVVCWNGMFSEEFTTCNTLKRLSGICEHYGVEYDLIFTPSVYWLSSVMQTAKLKT